MQRDKYECLSLLVNVRLLTAMSRRDDCLLYCLDEDYRDERATR